MKANATPLLYGVEQEVHRQEGNRDLVCHKQTDGKDRLKALCR